MANTTDYQIKAADWRKQLRVNERRTRVIIVLFILIYLIVGLLVDLVINTGVPYYQGDIKLYPTLTQTLVLLLTFKIVPYACISAAVVALISILVTYRFYDKIMLMGTTHHEITASSTILEDKQLFNVVEEMKVAAGLRYMPRIFIIEADYMNAFASGYSEKSALVAITRGLLNKLNRAELQAVMAHELSHIRHHDIKLTLMASVLANLMLIVIDILFYSIIFGRNRKEDNRLIVIIRILRYLLPLLTVVLTLYLSRTREYMADAGSVELMRDNQPLASALMKIQDDYSSHAQDYSQQLAATSHEEVRQAAYLYDPKQAGLKDTATVSIFSSHPSLEQRLKAIGFIKK